MYKLINFCTPRKAFEYAETTVNHLNMVLGWTGEWTNRSLVVWCQTLWKSIVSSFFHLEHNPNMEFGWYS